MVNRLFFLGLCCSILSLAFIKLGKDELEPFKASSPNGFPKLQIPENNQLTSDRIELGRRLFYDPVLSSDSTVSCASCHQIERAFADNKPISPGVDGKLAKRNAPTLGNVGYNPAFLFDGSLKTLEMQILVPIQEHAELNSNIVDIAEKLGKDSNYVRLSLIAYDRLPDPFVITRAIACFERILVTGNSKYDRVIYQKKEQFTASEKRGEKLFMKRLHCAKCHGGFNFTSFQNENNGLYKTYSDSGRMRVTHLESDRALFKIPSLRNIALTAPYMHDGSVASLEEVLKHYESGGHNHPNKNELIQPFHITEVERQDLINFLMTLTDSSFITNPLLSSPFD